MGFNNGIFTVDDWSPSTEALQPTSPDNFVASDSAQAGLDEIAGGLSQTLLRDGSVALTGDIDMGGNKIENLTAGVLDSDGVTKLQLDTVALAKADLDLQNVTSGAYATETVRGVNFLATDQDMVSLTDDTKAVTPLKAGKLLSGSNAYSPGYINELIPVWVDATNISCAGGTCRDYSDTINIKADATITKDISVAWEVGTGGGLADGATIGAGFLGHMFILAGGVSAATTGKFTTDDISANITNFQAVSDGYLTYRIDNGALQKAENLDFTSVSTVNDIANVFNAAIADAQVIAVGNTIQFSSILTGPSSTFTIFASTETGTDVYTLNYLDGDNGLATQGEAEQTETTDYGFDTDVDAINLMADANVVAAGLSKYRRIHSFKLNTSTEFYEFSAYGNDNKIEIYLEDVSSGNSSTLVNGGYSTVLLLKMPGFVEFKPNITYALSSTGSGEGTVKERNPSGGERIISYYKTTDNVGSFGTSDLSLLGASIQLKLDVISGTTNMTATIYENGYELTR